MDISEVPAASIIRTTSKLRDNPEDSHLQTRRYENLTSQTVWIVFFLF
jgi:hypothetical protein